LGSNLSAVFIAPSYYSSALIGHVSCMQPSWILLMSTWALPRALLTWSFIMFLGTHNAAAQLRVIPSCGPPLCEMLTSCGLTLQAMGDDPSWRWHIPAITAYSCCRTPPLHTTTTLAPWLHTFLLSMSSHPMTWSVQIMIIGSFYKRITIYLYN